jgi:NAD-dependent SIR2 family protein deacetylase
MPEPVRTSSRMKLRIVNEHRLGPCEKCGTQTEKEFYMDGQRKRVRMVCPKCGGMGRLIVRTTAIDAPGAPTCFKPKCVRKFIRDSIFCILSSAYHHKRVEYAEKHRNDNILEMYRTGLPMPLTIPQAIRENFRLIIRR